ncbi:MAG: VWA domain-containing protein [Gammaproteobacteria bacterium]|nr:VWA domain-containing protein [Gammaproteobacteria bacterium]
MTSVLLVALGTPQGSASAQQARPLTLEGKQALYQRVVAIPGAAVAATAGARATQPVTPFTVFYVYAREDIDGEQWLRVGLDSRGNIRGWLPASQAVAWRQTLTVGFKDTAEQPRVMLFEDRDALVRLAEANDVETYRSLRERAAEGDVADSPVAALQPEGFIDIRRNFYLVPILSHEDVLAGDYQARLLEVASVPLRFSAADDPYRAGIVFVIDTTVSMQPYIERTRELVRDVYEKIAEAGVTDRVSYGLVAFRDNVSAAPGLGYLTRVYSELTDDPQTFLSQVAGVRATTVSSRDFNEDPYAGIVEAIDSIDWSGYFARYVVLITDAGPRLADDPLSSTGLSTSQMRERLLANGIVPWVIHLKTASGARNENHEYAEDEYRALARIEDVGTFYHPVETGDVEDFGTALGTMMDELTAQVQSAAAGFQPLQAGPGRPTDDARDPALAEFQASVQRLGYALRMDYLRQATEDERAPLLFNAWMLDRDLEQPADRAIDVRVVLTRDQLSDLHELLRRILDRAEEGALAPNRFLDELRSLAAIVSRDPQAAQVAGPGASLAELGYMREYMEGLPYRSEVMNIDLSTWQQWTAQEQFEFINQLDSKAAYYRALHDNLDLWVSLDGGAVDGDSLYPLLLEALP